MAGRVKKPSKATEDEHMALEDAMQELAKQTDALLASSETEKKTVKPTLPKRKVIPHKKGAHLDIVGHAPSIIKKPKATTSPKEHLLEAHATRSFNEIPASRDNKISNKDSVASDATPVITLDAIKGKTTPAIIKSHVGTVIHNEEEKEEVKDTIKDKSANSIAVKVHPRTIEKNAPAKAAPAGSSVEEDGHLDLAEIDTPSNIDSLKENPSEETVIKDEPTHRPIEFNINEEEGEKKKAPSSPQLVKHNREKPHTFDTKEYHPELHDWSKLSSSSHWPVVVLLLLIAFAGALSYLYFTGKLPQF